MVKFIVSSLKGGVTPLSCQQLDEQITLMWNLIKTSQTWDLFLKRDAMGSSLNTEGLVASILQPCGALDTCFCFSSHRCLSKALLCFSPTFLMLHMGCQERWPGLLSSLLDSILVSANICFLYFVQFFTFS